MTTLPCEACRGLCCGPVPVKRHELKAIRKYLGSLPTCERRHLENQARYFGTCIFYDEIRNRCGIHPVKPSICRAFGHYRNLVCFQLPLAAGGEDWVVTELPVGVLSVDFTWEHFR